MKALKLITKILVIVLVTAVAFGGVYVQKQNKMKNQVKDYLWGMDLTGTRIVEFKVSDEKEEITKDKNGNIVEDEDKEEDGDYTTEEKAVNPEEVKTLDNYKKSKSILEKRLKKLGVNNYITKLDEENGTIIIEIPEDTQTDHTVSNVSQKGKFEIVDSEDTSKVLMDNSDIKKANVKYSTSTDGTTVYLNIEFTKEGKEKLRNISNEYKTVEESSSAEDSDEANETEENDAEVEGTENADEENETEDTENAEQSSEEATDDNTEENNETSEEETEQKKITMQIDENKMITTSFSETEEDGSLQLTMGQATTDTKKINDYIESATTVATILDTGDLPITYEAEGNQYVASAITKDLLIKLAEVELAVLVVALLVLVIKHKGMGILAVIEFIGFVSIYLLLLRYTNVILTLEGISAIAVIFTLNYIYNYRMLNKIKNAEEDEKAKAEKESFKEFCVRVVPICILSIVFCFISWTPISSFGMAMFWGLALIAIYNLTVTRSFLKK